MGRGRKIIDVDIVVEKAIELIEEEGFEDFSTRRLAARLGISAMTLYNYYENREAILDKALLRGFSHFWRGLPEKVDATLAMGADPLDAYRVLSEHMIAFALARPRLYSFISSRDIVALMHDERLAGPYLKVFSRVEGGADDSAGILARGAYLFELLASALASRAVSGDMSAERCRSLATEAFDRILSRDGAPRDHAT